MFCVILVKILRWFCMDENVKNAQTSSNLTLITFKLITLKYKIFLYKLLLPNKEARFAGPMGFQCVASINSVLSSAFPIDSAT